MPTRAEAIAEIQERATEYLQKDKRGRGFVCPICASGSGAHGTGITENKKSAHHFTCWAGCFTNADIIDIIGKEHNCTDFNEALEFACREFNIDYNELTNDAHIEPVERKAKALQRKEKQETNRVIEQDLSEFFTECKNKLQECDYLTDRGISRITQEMYGIGYTDKPTPRIIFPSSKYSYNARIINPKQGEGKCYKPAGVKARLFNAGCIDDAETPVFIVEGETDALSFIEIGYKAVALCGTSNIGLLVDRCIENPPIAPLIIALDADEAGNKNAESLEEQLTGAGIECYNATTIYNNYKDANEYLQKDKAGFMASAHNTCIKAESEQNARQEAYQAEYCTLSRLAEFRNGILESANTPAISTGIEQLDKYLDGGLYEGLYIVGAISSLGKTTFVQQVADHIAKAGHDILYFSLEMSRRELIAKSISRETAEISLAEHDAIIDGIASRTRHILNGSWYANYTEERKQTINRAVDNYRRYAGNIYIFEGIGDIGTERIAQAIEKHKSITGATPVVVVDYLQIMAPPVNSIYRTDKQIIDKGVLELKRISRDYKTPVIGISSFNRDNYNAVADMQAFKESGAIEYGCDILLALQLKGVENEKGQYNKDFNIAQALSQPTREIELKILKQRNGETRKKVQLCFVPKYNLFFTPQYAE